MFSRPELKVERVTYPVMTPTAARGVLEAIFWKPQMRYRVVAIEVLRPIRQFTIRRNETHQVVSLSAAVRGDRVDTAATATSGTRSACVRSPTASTRTSSGREAGKDVAAYRDQFRRRVTRGACFHQPFLGTKEFSADFGDPDDSERIRHTEDLGVMLHTIHFGPPVRMEWFTARLDDGVLHVPAQGIEVPGSPAGEG